MESQFRCVVIRKLYIAIIIVCWGIMSAEQSLGHAVAQLIEALRYKSEGRGFDSLWCRWKFSLN